MGQQQLLLLVLGIVIVGIAVVAGIQAFAEGKAKAEQDAAVSDAMRIVSDIQAWKLKPTAFGGGSESDWSGVSFAALGYQVETQDTYVTYNGCYGLTPASNQVTLAVYRDTTSAGTCGSTDSLKIADVVINGAGTDDITWTYTQPGSGT